MLSEKQPPVTLIPLAETGIVAPEGWCALDARGLLRVEGKDAESFLQGQLTQDMARVRAGAVLLAAHCTPKGRISTLFRCWHDERGFLLDCPASMLAAAQRRLGMYVLRAAARVTSVADQYCRIGVCGRTLAARLSEAGIALPGEPGATVLTGELQCTALAGERWLILCDTATGARVRAALSADCAPDNHIWALASLLAGDPEVLPETAEQFIPQMLNLDLLDGVSFRKGCYTGQEIVARTHYLGRVKRRMQCFGYRADAPPDGTTPLELKSATATADPAGLPAAPAPVAATATAIVTAQLVIALQDGPHGGVLLAVLATGANETPEGATPLPPAS